MRGLPITEMQIKQFRKARNGRATIKVAAAAAGFCEKTFYNNRDRLQEKQRRNAGLADPGDSPAGRVETRGRKPDPEVDGVFAKHVVPMLEKDPGAPKIEIIERLIYDCELKIVADRRRTFERRIDDWQALNGKDKEIFFPRRKVPGREMQVDFVDLRKLGVTVSGKPLAGKIFHAVLKFSGQCYAEVSAGGETLEALCAGAENAVESFDGSPERILTDRLSAACRNSDWKDSGDATDKWAAFCAHIGVRHIRTNPASPHENGLPETVNGHNFGFYKRALKRRGGRDFESVAAFQKFIDKLIRLLNGRRSDLFAIESDALKRLPARKFTDCESTEVRVNRFGLVRVGSVGYNVPTRLLGRKLRAFLHRDRLDLYFKGALVASHERGTSKRDGGPGYVINAEFLLPWALMKPRMLQDVEYARQLVAEDSFWLTLELALKRMEERKACRLAAGLLELIVKHGCGEDMDAILSHLLSLGLLPDIERLRSHFESGRALPSRDDFASFAPEPQKQEAEPVPGALSCSFSMRLPACAQTPCSTAGCRVEIRGDSPLRPDVADAAANGAEDEAGGRIDESLLLELFQLALSIGLDMLSLGGDLRTGASAEPQPDAGQSGAAAKTNGEVQDPNVAPIGIRRMPELASALADAIRNGDPRIRALADRIASLKRTGPSGQGGPPMTARPCRADGARTPDISKTPEPTEPSRT